MVILSNIKPRCFLDIEINLEPIGRIVIELFNDVCPKTCENFLQLCTGDAGISPTSNKRMCYAGTPIHRIVKDFMIQGGDFENGDGTGGESIYFGMFDDENLTLKHSEAGLVSMANRGKNTNGSQFFILTKPAPHLDGKHVIFGRVVQGMDVVSKLENLKVSKDLNRPIDNVRISTTGQLVLVRKNKNPPKKKVAKESSSSGSESESSSGDSSSDSSSSSSSSQEEEMINVKRKKKSAKKMPPPVTEEKIEDLEKTIGNVREGEVPDIPPNKFLYRKSPPKRPEEPDVQPIETKEIRSRRDSDRPIKRSEREDKSRTEKIKIKGRGIVRYRPEKRGNSRSTTPPHWRREQEKIKPLKSTLDQINKEKWQRSTAEQENELDTSRLNDNRKVAGDDTKQGVDLRSKLNKKSLVKGYESSESGEYDLRQGPRSKVESKNRSPETAPRRVLLAEKQKSKNRSTDMDEDNDEDSVYKALRKYRDDRKEFGNTQDAKNKTSYGSVNRNNAVVFGTSPERLKRQVNDDGDRGDDSIYRRQMSDKKQTEGKSSKDGSLRKKSGKRHREASEDSCPDICKKIDPNKRRSKSADGNGEKLERKGKGKNNRDKSDAQGPKFNTKDNKVDKAKTASRSDKDSEDHRRRKKEAEFYDKYDENSRKAKVIKNDVEYRKDDQGISNKKDKGSDSSDIDEKKKNAKNKTVDQISQQILRRYRSDSDDNSDLEKLKKDHKSRNDKSYFDEKISPTTESRRVTIGKKLSDKTSPMEELKSLSQSESKLNEKVRSHSSDSNNDDEGGNVIKPSKEKRYNEIEEKGLENKLSKTSENIDKTSSKKRQDQLNDNLYGENLALINESTIGQNKCLIKDSSVDSESNSRNNKSNNLTKRDDSSSLNRSRNKSKRNKSSSLDRSKDRSKRDKSSSLDRSKDKSKRMKSSSLDQSKDRSKDRSKREKSSSLDQTKDRSKKKKVPTATLR